MLIQKIESKQISQNHWFLLEILFRILSWSQSAKSKGLGVEILAKVSLIHHQEVPFKLNFLI